MIFKTHNGEPVFHAWNGTAWMGDALQEGMRKAKGDNWQWNKDGDLPDRLGGGWSFAFRQRLNWILTGECPALLPPYGNVDPDSESGRDAVEESIVKLAAGTHDRVMR